MPKKGKSKGSKSGSSSVSSTDRLILTSHKATGSTTNVVWSDLALRRQNFNIVQRPPKQLSNQIFWCQMSSDDLISLSNVSTTEANVIFAGNSFNGFSAAAAFFDQYCIYCVTVTLSSLVVEASFPAIQCYTAIDYDSVSNIGKAALEGYSSFNYTSLGSGGQDSLVRLIKPCIANQVTSSNLPVPGGVSRQWIDIAYPSVQHYGFRNIFDTYTAVVTNAVHRVYTAVFGFRNNI